MKQEIKNVGKLEEKFNEIISILKDNGVKDIIGDFEVDRDYMIIGNPFKHSEQKRIDTCYIDLSIRYPIKQMEE